MERSDSNDLRNPSHWDDIATRTGSILDVRAEMERRGKPSSLAIERVVSALTVPAAFLGMAVFSVIWVVANTPVMPWGPWDPYPYMLLATLASVTAPLLSVLILMHQERDQRIAELREETQLQVELHSELQLTMTLRLIDELRRGLRVETEQDEQLLTVLQETLDPKTLMDNLRKELETE